MPITRLIPLPVRDALRRPYHALRSMPGRVREAWLKAKAEREARDPAAGVRVEVVEGFAPTVDRGSYDVFREYYTDPDMREEIRHFLRWVGAEGRPTQFLDVGAHYGIFVLAALKAGAPGTKVLALEPSPPAFAMLRKNLAPADADRVAARRVALGDAPGELVLHVTDDGRGMMNVVREEAKYGYTTEVTPVETLDGLCEREGFAPTAVKVDVEGFEYEVLRGARRVLAADRPTVFLELHGHHLKQRGLDPRAALEPLQAAGYTIEAVNGPTDAVLSAVVDGGAVRRFIARPPR